MAELPKLVPKVSKKKATATSELEQLLRIAQDKNLGGILKKYEKEKKPKLSALQRAGSALTAFETGEALYSKIVEKKPFFPSYAQNIKSGLKTAFTGLPDEGAKPKRTYKDILLKTGSLPDRPGKIDLVDIEGIAGDILFDPTTFLGSGIGKGFIKVSGTIAKKGAALTASKFPKMGEIASTIGDLFKPNLRIAADPLLKSSDPYLQRIGRKFEDSTIKFEKGTVNIVNQILKPLQNQQKIAINQLGANSLDKITYYRETGTISGNPFIDQEVKKIGAIYDQIKQREIKEGLLESTIDNYVRRIATPEFLEANKARPNLIQALPKPIRLRLDPANPRKLDFTTIKEANDWSKNKLGFKMFEEDPYKALAYRLVEHEKAIRTNRYLNDIKVFGQNIKPGTIDQTGLKWVESTAPQLKGVSLPEPIAKYVDKARTILTNDTATKKLIQWYDNTMSFWKGSVYGWFPASQTTNAIGGMFHNYIAGAVKPKLYSDATLILNGSPGTITTKSGEKINFNAIRQWLNEYGVVGESGYLDVPGSLRIGVGESTLQKVQKWPQRVMGHVENRLRVPLFIHGLEKGMSPGAAAKNVVKYHFDYTPVGLSEFEKSVLKRIIPFYTFTRNVIPLTIQQMLLQPQKYATVYKTQRATGLKPEDEEVQYLPDYLKQQILIKKDDKYWAGFKLPFEEALGKLENPLRGFGISVAPVYKIPIEALTGVNIFKGIKIKDDVNGQSYKDMPQFVKDFLEYKEVDVPANKDTGRKGFTKYYVNPWKKYTVENFPFTSRLWNNIIRTSSSGDDPKKLLILITAIRDYTENVQTYDNKGTYEKKLLEELQALLERSYGGFQYEKFVLPKEEGQKTKTPISLPPIR